MNVQKEMRLMGWVCEEEEKKSLFGNFLHLLQFSSLFSVCTIICAWILGNRFLTNASGGKKDVHVVELILK